MSNLFNLVVYFLKIHINVACQATGDVGVGRIGNYSHRSYSVEDVELYKPLKNAHLVICGVGKFEAINAERFALVNEKDKAKKVIAATRKVHLYGERFFSLSLSF